MFRVNPVITCEKQTPAKFGTDRSNKKQHCTFFSPLKIVVTAVSYIVQLQGALVTFVFPTMCTISSLTSNSTTFATICTHHHSSPITNGRTSRHPSPTEKHRPHCHVRTQLPCSTPLQIRVPFIPSKESSLPARLPATIPSRTTSTTRQKRVFSSLFQN